MKRRLKNVRSISGSWSAFAAVLSDGTVETWGSVGADLLCLLVAHRTSNISLLGAGADSASVVHKLRDVVAICASDFAFAALRRDGIVVSWGNSGLSLCFLGLLVFFRR